MSDIKQKRFGDRKDAWRVKDLDPLHKVMNLIIGKRTENEAVCSIELDMSALNSFIANINANEDVTTKYTFFHAVLAALAVTIKERKCLNYFIRNNTFWERKIISFSYVAKRKKVDGSEENIIIQEFHPESDVSPIKQMHDKTVKEVNSIRESEDNNSDTAAMINKFLKLPMFILKIVVGVIKILDKKGRIPYALSKDIPYSSTVFVSNLGSIKFDASYHHLVNFGTNSIFLIIGKKHFLPEYNKDGSYVMKEYLPLTFTLDERIADGVYFANSIKLFQALLLKPEMLDRPSNEKLDIEKLYEEVYGEIQ